MTDGEGRVAKECVICDGLRETNELRQADGLKGSSWTNLEGRVVMIYTHMLRMIEGDAQDAMECVTLQ